MANSVKLLPNADRDMVVQILRDALADAEAGNIVACVVATMLPGGGVRGGWGGALSFHEKVGLLEQMKHQMLAVCEDGDHG